MQIRSYFIYCFLFFACCSMDDKGMVTTREKEDSVKIIDKPKRNIDPKGIHLEERILVPKGYERIAAKGFATFLRHLKLKPDSSEVKLFNGEIKTNMNVYDAVVDLDIGKKDLHQCADAVMRLRAEYLWSEKQYDKLHFNLTNGFRVDYKEWMNGKRIKVKGNKTSWMQTKTPSNTYKDFWEYMELIFNYAGTLSLSKELLPVNKMDLKIGDVFIRGGLPGHAIMVVDMAINPKTNEKIFLLAQSYMPAQETQILKNRNDSLISPWYSLDFELLDTPEWSFDTTEIKRFSE